MHDRRTAKAFIRSYDAYVSLLGALGHDIDEKAILEHVTECPEQLHALRGVISAWRSGHLNGEMLNAAVVDRMERLRESLAEMIGPEARRLMGNANGQYSAEGLPELLRALPETRRDHLADLVLFDGHRGMVRPRFISVEAFQQLLSDFAGQQTIARRKLIRHMRREFHRRGIEMSPDTIEERFRPNPAVRTMPWCAKQVLRHAGDEFRTGLIPIEDLVGNEDPDRWLERAQHALQFRSQSAMHKAIAEATDLSYDCIHKALSGKDKAERIQAHIKQCLDRWLETAARGNEIGARDEYRGVPVEELCALLPALTGRFDTKEALYRAVAEQTGVRAGSVRRYFQNDGKLKFAPLSVYRVAKQLSGEPADGDHCTASVPRPADERRGNRQRPLRHDSISSLARRARRALGEWHRHRDDPQCEDRFRQARLDLIARLDHRRHTDRCPAAR